MSVIASPSRKSRRWLHLWPLALFILLAIGGSIWLWQAWPQVMMKSIIWQREVNQQMSGLLKAVAENPTKAGGSLLAFSFIYGVLHALGPGHGKIVITTWLATHPSKLKSSIGLTLASSLLQGGVAIGLVVVVLSLLQLPAGQLHMLCAGGRAGADPLLASAEKTARAAAKTAIQDFYAASRSR